MREKLFFILVFAVLIVAANDSAMAQQRFIASLRGNQEVPANNSTGGGTCSIILNAAETQISVTCNYAGLGTAATAAHIHENGSVGVNGPILFNFGSVSGTGGAIGSPNPLTFAVTPAQVAAVRAKRWYVNLHTTGIPSGEIRGQIKLTSTNISDRDGDGRADATAFRFNNATFYSLGSLNSSYLTANLGSGTNADIFLNNTGDFDGDGIFDPLILSSATGNLLNWRILQSSTNTVLSYDWGGFSTAGIDTLAPADYDGDGRTDIAIFRRSNAVWYILESSTGQPRFEYWGAPNDFPAVGDYDGDGKADLTTVRVVGTQRVWFTRFSRNGQTTSVPWGNATTDSFFFFSPVDVDGDGKQDRLAFRNVSGQQNYFVLRSSDNSMFTAQWGLSGDTGDGQLFGDYDGDGKTDLVARRVQNGRLIWYILRSSDGQPQYLDWGLQLDQ